MDGSKRTLFLVASLAVFLAALGVSSVRLALRYSENLRKSQSVFETLSSAASRTLAQTGPQDEAWRTLVRTVYRNDDSVLLVVLHAPGTGILHMMPKSAPYLDGSPQTAPVPPELYYPPQTVSRLSAVVGSAAGSPVTLELLYSLARQRDVYEAARLGLILAAAWTALCLLSATAATLRSGSRTPAAVPASVSGGPAPGPVVPGPVLPDEDFQLPEIPPNPDGAADRGESGPSAPSRESPPPREPSGHPRGLYSPDSGLGWPEYLPERLGAELSRAASFEQDLVLMELSHEGISRGSPAYRVIIRILLEFFSFRDLAFEQDPAGLAVILPNIDAEHALRMAEEFLKKVTSILREEGASSDYRKIFIGLSSRSGRLVDSERVITEARAALTRAREEGDSRIVAFKADPNKYRDYIAARP
ncbi:MAG TPA: hypothetical protein P5313_03165 [Spirochaetia bacterium]|nr:hypothetical protein [Spirochaetales bacterium]HRY79397.1 hypothetical protein [Spirochaetia bacterium]